MKVLLTGAKGMLAKAVKYEFMEEDVICTDVEELDITNIEKVDKQVSNIKPDLIINCAAYTNVDKAEEQQDISYKVNALGPKNLAIIAERNGSILVHISTDYVFAGEKAVEEYYKEEDYKNPQSVYGITKLEGEKFIEKNCSKYYIFRTAWLYGDGDNFVRKMINLSKIHNEVNVVNDQYGSPTYTVDLANMIHQSINKKIPFGIYNATNLGYTTWYNFAKEIYKIKNIKCLVNPITSDEIIRLAKRPRNSQMSKEKLLKSGIMIPEYHESLKKYLSEDKEINYEY